MKTLILMANSEWGQWVQLENGHFEVVEEREHPQSKDKVEHLVSDRPGRTFSSVSTARHSLNEGQEIMDEERHKFAREVFRFSKQRYLLFPYKELWVVAGPKFIGELRPLFQSISDPPYLIREIHKEVSPRESIEGKMGKVYEWVYGNSPRKGSLHKFS